MASGKPRPQGSAESIRTILHTRLEDEAKVRACYEFGKKLGQGSFGVVLEAVCLRDESKWAVKIISKDTKEKDRSTAFKMLEREVAILKQVQHEHIIHLEEVFETSKKMYLIMEYCEGGELADALKVKKKYGEGETKIIIRKLASAIQYLHKKDIVHRDLKLENILLTHNPECPEDHLHIKVTDFGLSVVKDGVGYDSMMQAVCGTPVYMSPEIIHNKTYSQQCDVWAMGIIMYTLLCGNPPFMAEDEEKLYELIKRGNINFPDVHFKYITEEGKNCICGMLKVDPAHRYTASEVLEHSWISGRQMKAGPMNVLEMMKQWKTLNLDSENLESCAIDLDSPRAAISLATGRELLNGIARAAVETSEELESEVEIINGGLERRKVGSSPDHINKSSSSCDGHLNHKLTTPPKSSPANSARGLKTKSSPVQQYAASTQYSPSTASPGINRKATTASSPCKVTTSRVKKK